MKYLISNGKLFKISDRNWKAFMKAKAAGYDPSFAEFNGSLLSYDLEDISNWDMEDFKNALGHNSN